MSKIKDNMPSKRKIVSFIVFCFAIFSVFITAKGIIGADSKDKTDRVSGYKPVIVVTGSMVPAVEVNSISILKYCSIDDLVIGDIVMFVEPMRQINITHRVIDMEYNDNGEVEYITTKGDANPHKDNIRVTGDMVVGKIIKTNNAIAPYISKFMISPGELNSVAVLQSLLRVSLIVIILGVVIYNLWVRIVVLFIASKGKENYLKYLKIYEDNINENNENLQELRKLVDRDDFRSKVAKGRAVREIKNFVVTNKDIRRAMKSIRNITKK